MSEEIKSLKDYISTTKNEIFTTFKTQTISNLIIYYEDLQQKVEHLEKENKILKGFVDKVNWENMLLRKKNNQLENIRKEAIKYIEEKADYPISYYHCLNDLLNILNKGSEEK